MLVRVGEIGIGRLYGGQSRLRRKGLICLFLRLRDRCMGGVEVVVVDANLVLVLILRDR